jgi:hypothetical protein
MVSAEIGRRCGLPPFVFVDAETGALLYFWFSRASLQRLGNPWSHASSLLRGRNSIAYAASIFGFCSNLYLGRFPLLGWTLGLRFVLLLV